MNEERARRKLSGIRNADAVGYSCLNRIFLWQSDPAQQPLEKDLEFCKCDD